MTIVGLYLPSAPEVPQWVRDSVVKINDQRPNDRTDFVVAGKEWIPDASMQDFRKRAGNDFLLIAPQHASVRGRLSDLTLSTGDGSFQAFGAQIVREDKDKVVPGVAYRIEPIKTSDTYRWVVAPEATPLTFGPPLGDESQSKISRIEKAIEDLKKASEEQNKEIQELRKAVEELRRQPR